MITFKEYIMIEDALGRHGEYINDVAEKTMINKIIALLLNNDKSDESYDLVYSFIEDSRQEAFYDKYYDAFAEMSEQRKEHRDDKSKVTLSPTTGKLLGEFKKEVGPLFQQWKKTRAVKEGKDEKLHSGTKNGKRAYKDYTNFKGVSPEEKRELKLDRSNGPWVA